MSYAAPSSCGASAAILPGRIIPDRSFPERRVYSIEESRTLLGGISRKSVYDLINSGSLFTVKLAGRRLVPAEAIESLIGASYAAPPSATARVEEAA